MTTEQLFDFKKGLEREGILFCYSGPVSQGLIEEIGEVIKRKMQAEETTLSIIQKVFGVFVEQVQNIMFYSAETRLDEAGNELRSGIAVVGKEQQAFYILCGNLVDRDERDRLERLLAELVKKNRDELNSMYKQRLKEGSAETRRSAGLGLIEVARKSSRPLAYSFCEVDNTFCFFASKAMIEQEAAR